MTSLGLWDYENCASVDGTFKKHKRNPRRSPTDADTQLVAFVPRVQETGKRRRMGERGEGEMPGKIVRRKLMTNAAIRDRHHLTTPPRKSRGKGGPGGGGAMQMDSHENRVPKSVSRNKRSNAQHNGLRAAPMCWGYCE